MDRLARRGFAPGKAGRALPIGIIVALCGTLLTACAAVDTPEACRLEHVVDLPIRLVNGVPVIMAQIDGKPLRMVLDTGADGLVVTPAAADRLGLDRDYSRFGTLTGLGAQASFWPTNPVALQLGSVTTAPKSFVIGTVPVLRGRNTPEGLLGSTVLSAYDLDIDIPQRRLALYQSRRCPSGPAPFAGPSVAVQVSQVGPLRMAAPVLLDGKAVSMLVDTGTGRSMVDPAAAGVTEATLQGDRAAFVSTADPVGLSARLHTFRSLQLGSDVVDNPLLMVARVDQPGFNGLLGTDYWRSRRLWISYGSRTLFVGLPAPQ